MNGEGKGRCGLIFEFKLDVGWMNHSYGSFEAKNQLAELLRRVEAGEEIIITRHRQPVARLLPWEKKNDSRAIAKTFSSMKRLREKAKIGRKKNETLAALAHEGHRW